VHYLIQFFFRLAELSALPTALNTTHSLIEFVKKQCVDYEKNRPWVPTTDRERLSDMVDDLSEWLNEQLIAQAKLTAFEPAVIESEQLYERLRPIHKLSEQLMKLKKPIEKPKPKPKPVKTNSTAGNKTETEETVNTTGSESTGNESTQSDTEKETNQETKEEEQSQDNKSDDHNKEKDDNDDDDDDDDKKNHKPKDDL